ncbi:MAG: tripartite tricarboxylate transporter substrate binding protein [Burkholderiaceae bacterium]|nr:tripartite tricarboxylate transporter substrate binding protein [Burkholderiaceae bacterium]MDO9089559.1 tripartite tricarboxylate transporter substrate binding protein [Burkholderiaceae bacterium]MDP1968403.1 tripartite tricarboxylate transporter substrate binding protein [Burkholderiaceae bacterium]
MAYSPVRRRLVTVLLAVAALNIPALAQTFPTKPIHIIATTPAGGGNDIYARLLASGLSAKLGQPVLVENVGGSSGMIALERVSKAPKDGYTLVAVTSTSISAAPHMYRKLPFKVEDFVPVALSGTFPFYAFTTPSLPVNNWKEFVDYARANPGRVNYATSGPGSTPHLVGEMVKAATGINMVNVPYKGAAPAQADLMAGHVQIYFDIPTPGLSYVKAGKLKVLGVLDHKRTSAAPEVATMTELGYPSLTAFIRFSLLAPAGTPKAVIDRINQAALQAMESGPLRDRQVADGAVPGPVSADQLAALLKTDYETWGAVARRLDLQLD